MKGFIPQINMKAGYAFADTAIMYGKLGCVWSKVVYSEGNQSSSKSKANMVFGIGAEKALCGRFTTALEADYSLGFKDGPSTYNKGISVRALVKYNIKF